MTGKAGIVSSMKKETAQQRHLRRHNLKHSGQQSKEALARRGGPIYNAPRQAVFCNRCSEPCGMYPTGKAGSPKKKCSNCPKEAPKIHCNFCATTESPQWRTWKRFHLCNACGIKVWRKRDTDYYGPMPGKRSANRVSLKKKDIDGGLDLLQFLKDSGEL